MSNGGLVTVFAKLGYWDAYWAAVILTLHLFKKVLLIFGIMAAMWLFLLVVAQLRPRSGVDWQQIITNDNRLLLVFLLPVVFVFVLPLLSARKVLTDERVKKGVKYQFSDEGIRVESSVATADLQWVAFRRVIETRSAFLLLPTSNLAHTLPLRCFAGEADVKTARELFRMKIPQAKLHRD
jgi:hypothetical protein